MDLSPAARCCLRYRWRLRHILVDEYQDTSPAQQRLLQVTLFHSFVQLMEEANRETLYRTILDGRGEEVEVAPNVDCRDKYKPARVTPQRSRQPSTLWVSLIA